MTTDHDLDTRTVLSWLREETHETVEHVLLRALDEVDTTPQRRSLRLPWRANGMQTYARLFAGAAAVLVVAIVGYSGFGGSRPTQPTLTAPPYGPAGNGIIAFEKDGDILAADRHGGGVRPLVAGPEFDSEPMFSPDGTRLAFRRETDAEPVLMVADADGTNVVQVTSERLEYWSFAPDGRSVVGVTWIDDEPRVIVRPVDPAATPTVLDIHLRLGGQELFEWGGPRFRPTNPLEILVKARPQPDGPRGIYVYDLATGEIRTIVEPAACDDNAVVWADRCYLHDVAWSTTGDHIFYRLGAEARVVAADGSDDRAVDNAWTTTYDNQVSPSSNDETRVVVARDTGGVVDGQQAVVSTDGEGQLIALTCGPTTDIVCAASWIWSPDDSILLGATQHITSDSTRSWSYQLANPATGQVTELDWDGDGTPTWQRVAWTDSSSPGDGSVPVGPHVMGGRLHGEDRVTVTVPSSGWFAPDEGSLTKDLGDGDRATVVIVPGDYYTMPRDICDWQIDDADLRGTYWPGSADQFVALLAEQTHHTPDGSRTPDLPAPEDVTIDGSSGQRIRYSYPDGDVSACDEQRFCLLQDRDSWGCLLSRQEPGVIDTLWVVDPPEGRNYFLVVTASGSPGPALRDEAKALVSSITFYVE